MKGHRFGSKKNDQTQARWELKQSLIPSSINTSSFLTPLGCILLLIAWHTNVAEAQRNSKINKSSSSNPVNNNTSQLSTNSTAMPEHISDKYSSEPAHYSPALFQQSPIVFTQNSQKKPLHANNADKVNLARQQNAKATKNSEHTEEVVSLEDRDTALMEIINTFIISCDPRDAKVVGLSTQEYIDKCTNYYTVRLRNNLYYAASPSVLKRILKSPGHVLLYQPAIMHSGGLYDSSQNLIVIGFDENTSDHSIQQFLRNEYFHAMTCVKADGRIIKKVQEALSVDEIEKLKGALKKGHERIINYKKMYDFYINNSPEFKDTNKFQQFMKAVVVYHAAATDRYLTTQEYQDYLKSQEGLYESMKDGRIKFKAGTFTHHDKISHVDMYITFNKSIVPGKVVMQQSFLKDDTATSKARAFFSDFYEYQNQYSAEGGTYVDRSSVMKVHEMASDVAQLPSALKKILFPECCTVFNEIAGVNDYCEIKEEEYVCEGSFCTPKMRA